YLTRKRLGQDHIEKSSFIDFVANSYLFRVECVSLILHLIHAGTGLSVDARADKLLNSEFDQFQIVAGSFCSGSLSNDKALKDRLEILCRSIPIAVQYAEEDWTAIDNWVTSKSGSASCG
ncbi:MAG: hypothetical protein L3J82_07810, partial [Planctomycetes bacterium]|nr:hypothetical protein [Planctomycetota bacterium]